MDTKLSKETRQRLSERDYQFFRRVFSGDQERYEQRLRRIGLVKHRRVLDAGCGFGQWLFALARLNKNVVGVDADDGRTAVCAELARKNGFTTVEVNTSTLETMDFAPASFDAIFSYSTLYLTDSAASLRRFAELLKPGGKLYLSTNSWGRYLQDLVQNPNSTTDYSVRRFALRTLFRNLIGAPAEITMTPSRTVRQQLHELGFTHIRIGPEGSLTETSAEPPEHQFFNHSYAGFEAVYEVLATR